MSFIFGGDTGLTYDQIKRRQAIVDQLTKGALSAPKNVGEGLNAIGQALMARSLGKKLDAQRQQLQQMQGDEDAFPLGQYDPESQERLRSDPSAMEAPQIDPREIQGGYGLDALDGGSGGDALGMAGVPPSGVGEESQLNALARSFQGLMKSLDDYETTFKDGGSTMWPGARKDKLDVAHRDLQMQMKELYNLGVLNGPDLDLMNQILLSPTSITGNMMDFLGGDKDMESRIPNNIEQVRKLMMNRTTPALQQLGIDPETLMPQKEKPLDQLSDDELMKMLTGG